MRSTRGFAIGVVLVLILAGAGCRKPTDDARIYTLYRNSAEAAAIRIHVATFDADEEAGYNKDNCDAAQELFQRHRGTGVKYWCEVGRYGELAP